MPIVTIGLVFVAALTHLARELRPNVISRFSVVLGTCRAQDKTCRRVGPRGCFLAAQMSHIKARPRHLRRDPP